MHVGSKFAFLLIDYSLKIIKIMKEIYGVLILPVYTSLQFYFLSYYLLLSSSFWLVYSLFLVWRLQILFSRWYLPSQRESWNLPFIKVNSAWPSLLIWRDHSASLHHFIKILPMLPLSFHLKKITKGRIEKFAYKLLKGNIIKHFLFLCVVKNRGSDPFY